MNNVCASSSEEHFFKKYPKTRWIILAGCFILVVLIYIASNVKQKGQIIAIEDPAILYNSEDIIVYFGRDTCISCGEATKYILSILPECSNDIYYYNTDTFRQTSSFTRVLEDFGIVEVPMLVKVQNGMCYESILLVSDEGKIQKECIRDFLIS